MAIISTKSKDNKKQNFTELIEQNKLRFYKTAKIILKNDDDIYDAIQEALISIYQNFEELKNKEYFATWATRIVINKCYDLLRKNKKNMIPIDQKIENDINTAQYDEYEVDKYGIKKAMESLNENQKLITISPQLDTTKVGPNSIYLGALELEIPSTTNSEYTSSIYVKTMNKNTTIDEYKEQVRAENTESASEYYEEKSGSEVDLKNQKGYQITAETTDGEEKYIKQDIFTIVNGKVYRITFFGSEKEYNNLKNDIEEFLHNFKVIK